MDRNSRRKSSAKACRCGDGTETEGPSLNMSGRSSEDSMAQIQDKLKAVQLLVGGDLPKEHNAAEATVATINKMHEKLNKDPAKKLTPATKKKLKTLYDQAVEQSQKEEQVIRAALEKIYEIRAIRERKEFEKKQFGNKDPVRRGVLMKSLQDSARTLPLFLGKAGETPPPLCGAVPAALYYIAKVGDMVAALQQQTPEEESNWILAEVVNYNGSTGKYELDDIDDEQKEKLHLVRRRVIPLPLMRADPQLHPTALFPKNSVVMAIFPQTTCFYKCVVNAVPTTHTDEYEVIFEDPNYLGGYGPPMKIAQRYVICYRDKKVNKNSS